MTAEPQGGQPPRGHDALAALAVQVDELRARVVTMEEKGPGAILVLSSEVKKLSDALKRALGQGKTLVPQAPWWPAGRVFTGEYNRTLGELRDWVNGFLAVQYPGYPIPACWPAHREAVWELATLHAEWSRVYADDEDDQPLADALWFHERWFPGVRNRLFGPNGAVQCTQTGCILTRPDERTQT